ncbi:MAG: hypothetical protein ABFS35_22755 [Bacteroidota bacterium]
MKSKLFKLSSLFTLLLIFTVGCQKDELDNNLILKAEPVDIVDPTISEKLENFKAYEFKNFEKNNFQESMNLEIHFGNDYKWNLYLKENISLTENLESYMTTDKGTLKVEQNSKHYMGKLKGNAESNVRVSFYSNKMAGFIYDGNKTYQIIHLKNVSDLMNYPDVMLVCKDSDIIINNVNL